MAKKINFNNNDELQNTLQEPLVAYGYNPPLTVSALFGSATSTNVAYSQPIQKLTLTQKWQLVRTGISKSSLEDLKQKAHLDYDQLAQALLVTRATLINKKGKEKFSAAVSEGIVSLADVYAFGYEVFDDVNMFNKWMFEPNLALNGELPYSMLDNQYGREEVKNIIGRIAYGVFA